MKKSVYFGIFAVSSMLLMGCGKTYSSNEQAELSSLKTEVKKLKAENASLKNGTSTTDSTSSSTESADTSNDSESKSYGMNEEGTLADGNGNEVYGLSITSVTKNFDHSFQEMMQYSKDQFNISNDDSVQFTYKYRNIGDTSAWQASVYDFAVYDSEGTAGDRVDQQEGQTDVTQGHSASATTWVTFDHAIKKGDKLSIEFNPDGEAATPLTYDVTVN